MAKKQPKSTPVTNKLPPETNRERKIKEVRTKLQNLSPRATAEVVNEVVSQQVNKQFGGFVEFLREQSVIGIGIGLVLGTQIKTVVDSIMNSFVNPITALFLPGKAGLDQQTLTVNFGDRSAVIGWGAIAYAIFTFVMVAIIIYAIFKILRLDKLTKKKE